MNEKIRELAEAAGQGEPYHIPPEFIDKFAELIVQDCINVVEQQKAKMSYGPTFVIEDIKRHFGVEE